MRDRAPCGACGGTGRAPLSEPLQRTLNKCRQLVARGDAITAPRLVALLTEDSSEPLPVKLTAMNNRLATLQTHGFLRRGGRAPRAIVYELTEEE